MLHYSHNILFSGKLLITGNELPFILGTSRNILCTWGGIRPVVKMEWFLQEFQSIALVTSNNSRAVTLSINQSTVWLDATTFICRATDTHGDVYEEHTTVLIKGTIINITHQPIKIGM